MIRKNSLELTREERGRIVALVLLLVEIDKKSAVRAIENSLRESKEQDDLSMDTICYLLILILLRAFFFPVLCIFKTSEDLYDRYDRFSFTPKHVSGK